MNIIQDNLVRACQDINIAHRDIKIKYEGLLERNKLRVEEHHRQELQAESREQTQEIELLRIRLAVFEGTE